jgi:hypothetical protein
MSYSFGPFRTWFQRRRQTTINNRQPQQRRQRLRLQLEQMEDRLAPAVTLLGSSETVTEGSGSAFAATITDFSVGAGADRLLVVSTGGAGSSADVTSVTFGGTALTQAIDQDGSFGATAEIWYLTLGSSGSATTGNVVVTYSANFFFQVTRGSIKAAR